MEHPVTPEPDRGGRERLPASGPEAMVIERDVPVPMDDGVVLRADVFRPGAPGRYPVILTYGPYAKGLAFQEGYADQWQLMVSQHPDVARGSTNAHQNWEVADPEKWVPDGYACVRVDSRGAGRSPGRVLERPEPGELLGRRNASRIDPHGAERPAPAATAQGAS